jgi:hypothetical protein
MNVQVQPHVTTTQRHLSFECVALVLHGGGALGTYQAGVYEAFSESGIHPVGSRAYPLARSTRRLSPATPRMRESPGCTAH